MNDLGEVEHAIQLALAPVFLVTGIAGVLNVVAGLARIIDRGRQLTEHPFDSLPNEMIEAELRSLERRRPLVSFAIYACTLSALLVCLVAAAWFVEAFLHLELKRFFGVPFTAATLSLVVGLTYCLREVHLATQTVRIRHGELKWKNRSAAQDESRGAHRPDSS